MKVNPPKYPQWPNPFISLIHVALIRGSVCQTPDFDYTWSSNPVLIAQQICNSFWQNAVSQIDIAPSPCRLIANAPPTWKPNDKSVIYSWKSGPGIVIDHQSVHAPEILDDIVIFLLGTTVLDEQLVDWALKRIVVGTTITCIEPTSPHHFWIKSLGLNMTPLDPLVQRVSEHFQLVDVESQSGTDINVTVVGVTPKLTVK